MLGLEPGRGRMLIGKLPGRYPGDAASRGEPEVLRLKNCRGGQRRMQIVIEHPGDRQSPAGLGASRIRALGRILAEQIMQGEPAGGRLVDQPGTDKLPERSTGGS